MRKRRSKYEDYDFLDPEYPTDNRKSGNAAIVAAVIAAALTQFAIFVSEGFENFWGFIFPILNLSMIKPILDTDASNWASAVASIYFAVAAICYIVIAYLIWGNAFLAFTYIFNTWYCICIMAVCIKKARQ